MPPIYDEYNDSYFVEFAPTTINENDYAYVESINSFTHVAHANSVNFIHDATESYYERGNMVVQIFMLLKHLSLC